MLSELLHRSTFVVHLHHQTKGNMKPSAELVKHLETRKVWASMSPMKRHNLIVALGLTKESGFLKYSLSQTERLVLEYLNAQI